MLTVKEMIEYMKDSADRIDLACGGILVDGFNWRNDLSVDAYGKYAVGEIHAVGEDAFEIDILMEPVVPVRA